MSKKGKFEPKNEKREKTRKQRKGLRIALAVLLAVLAAVGLYFLAGSLRKASQKTATDTNVASEADREEDAAFNTEAKPNETAAEQEIDSDACENPTETTADESENPKEDDTVHLIMVGDILLHQKVLDSGLQEDGSYDFSHLFQKVEAKIASADLALVNQETVLGGSTLGISEYPSFNSPQEIGDAEVTAGFDVILSATNHALDRGKDGVLATTEFWRTNYPGIAQIGMYDSQAASDNIYVYEQKGIKIAVLNYTYGTNGISLPADMPYAVNYLEESAVRADIEQAQELADFVVVCPHWGTEYSLTPDASQEKWCQIFLEEGVDLVIGAHPHVIEPLTLYTDDAGHEMPVYYSLGNFVCGTSTSGETAGRQMVGGMADVTIGFDETGQVSVLDYDVIPIVTHEGDGSDYTVYFLEDYTEELASENQIVSQEPNFSKEYCEDLVNEVWGN